MIRDAGDCVLQFFDGTSTIVKCRSMLQQTGRLFSRFSVLLTSCRRCDVDCGRFQHLSS